MLIFRSLRRVSAKLPAVPRVLTASEAELAGASSLKLNNSPVRVSPFDGVYFWIDSAKNMLQPRSTRYQEDVGGVCYSVSSLLTPGFHTFSGSAL